jgi:predicted lipoprotein with Yx(FWY)xxD motif
MKRLLFALPLTALVGGSLAGAAVLPTVKTAEVGTLGKVVVSSSGRTLYHYTDEKRGKVACTGACVKLWPPLLVKAGAKPVAGPGITASKLGVLKRPDGTFQVTYGAFGLYRYAGDKKAGDANGEAVESAWYAVSPAAKIVKDSAPAASSGGGGLGSSGYSTTTPGYDPGY